MSRFGEDPQAFFEAVYHDPAPWDIEAAQPDMVALLDAFPPEGPALDVGCGSGDLAIHLARRGLQTLGVDFVDEAIRQAEARREAEPEAVAARLSFRVADALRPSQLGERFLTVVDSGFYHLFAPGDGARYLEDLRLVLEPGGRLYLHAFAIEFPIPNVPRAVTEAELRDRCTAEQGWRILSILPGAFLSRVAPVPALLACIERV